MNVSLGATDPLAGADTDNAAAGEWFRPVCLPPFANLAYPRHLEKFATLSRGIAEGGAYYLRQVRPTSSGRVLTGEEALEEKSSSDLRRHLPSLAFVALAGLAIGAAAGVFIYAGVYNIGADAPHTKPVYWAIQNLRDRSIAVRSRDIVVPPALDAQKNIATGAGLYAEMCSGCHLAPGMEKTEISRGLYPEAPELRLGLAHTAAEEFWMIKHGVKMTAMPAWGRTHSDELIWDMVAFVRKLPSLSAQQYQALVKSAPEDHDTMMRDMPGMAKPTERDSAH